MSAPLRRLARSAPKATALLAAAARRAAETIGQGDPHAVDVLDDVKPVAGHLVAGKDVSGHLAPGDPRDPGRKQALLDLGRGRRLLAPLGLGEGVGVSIGQGDCGGGLPGHLQQRLQRTAEGDHHADRSPPKPQGKALRTGVPHQMPAEVRQTIPVELGADGERRLDLIGQPLGPGDAQQMGPVDVEHVEGDRDAGEALRLGHQLLWQQRGGDDVEDLDGIEDDGTLTAQVSRRKEIGRLLRGGNARSRGECLDHPTPVAEVAIHGRSRDAGRGGDVREGRGRRLPQQVLRRVEDALPIAERIGAT